MKHRYNPDHHHRRSIRLRGYDYTQAGAYFVTMVVQGRSCLFGEVVGAEMRLNEAGEMAHRVWEALPHRFPGIEMGPFVVMPNHHSRDHRPARNRRGAPCGRPIHAQQGNHKGCPYIGRCDRTGMGPGSRIVRCGGMWNTVTTNQIPSAYTTCSPWWAPDPHPTGQPQGLPLQEPSCPLPGVTCAIPGERPIETPLQPGPPSPQVHPTAGIRLHTGRARIS